MKKVTKHFIRKAVPRAAAFLPLLLCLFASSCGLSDLFGKAGVTMAPATTTKTPEQITTDAIPEVNASPMDFSQLDLDSYIELEYRGIKLTSSVEIRNITDELVSSELREILLYYGYYTLDTSRETAEGDTVEMEYTGYMDGEEFAGGKSDKATILLDNANSGYIAGFADGLIGKPCGTEIDLNLTFPENYYADLAGKPVLFKVTIHGICVPDDSDENAEKLSSGEMKTMAEYRAYLRDYLAELDDYLRFNDVSEKLGQALADAAIIKQEPAAQSEYYYQLYMNSIGKSAASYGMTISEYMAATATDEDDVRSDAADAALHDLIFAYIAKKENIEVTDEVLDDYINRLVNSYREQGYSYSANQLKELFEVYYGPDYLKSAALDEAVIQAVYRAADITYQP